MVLVNFLVDQIFGEAALFLGIIALVGLLIQKKSFSDVISGTLKTVIGVMILMVGVGILVDSILPVQFAFIEVAPAGGGEPAAIPGALGEAGLIAEYGSHIGLAMLFAFLINIVVARFTPIKHIFLTGHMLFWFPFVFVAVGVESGFSGTALTIFATIFTAAYMIIMPALITPFVNKVTGDNSFTLGHPTVGLAILSGFIGKWFGDKSKSTEDIKFPDGIQFLREITITSSLVIFIVYIVMGIIMGVSNGFGTIAGVYGTDLNWILFSFLQGLTFGAGLTLLLMGVRMMLAEIVPAFKGISDKLVPGAIPALDCPLVFPFAPNAVLIGFIVSMITSTIALVIIGVSGIVPFIILPLVITCFFEIGTAAVIANATGGRRGAILGAAVSGVVMIILVAVSVPFLRGTIADWILISADRISPYGQ